MNTQFSSIFPIDQVLPLQTTVDLGVMAKKSTTHYPKPSIIGALPSDCLVSYPEQSLREIYPSAEMQLMYLHSYTTGPSLILD